MQNFLINSNFSFLSAGFATVRNDKVWINYQSATLDGVQPQSSSWPTLVPIFAYHRIYLALDGEATMNLTDGSTLTMEKGKLYLIPPFKISSVGHTSSFSHFYLHFRSNTQINPFEYYNLLSPVPAGEKEIHYFCSLLPYLHTMLYDKKLENLAAQLQTQAYFSLLLSSFFQKQNPFPPTFKKFIPVLEYIDNHLAERITVKQLADLLGYTEAYFSTLFSQYFKVPPLKFITEKKMVSACQQLALSDLSIGQISANLGFENEFYFNTVFKKFFGLSPGKWKRQYISQNDGPL